MKFDNPKLTAFVLGELSGDDAREIQAAIDADPELQNEINDIQKTVAQLKEYLNEELKVGNRPPGDCVGDSRQGPLTGFLSAIADLPRATGHFTLLGLPPGRSPRAGSLAFGVAGGVQAKTAAGFVV